MNNETTANNKTLRGELRGQEPGPHEGGPGRVRHLADDEGSIIVIIMIVNGNDIANTNNDNNNDNDNDDDYNVDNNTTRNTIIVILIRAPSRRTT